MTEKAKSGRPPGRPPKAGRIATVDRKGIQDEPSDNSKTASLLAIQELQYENPTMFKRIFSAFKLLNTATVHLNFTKDGVHIYCIDHLLVNTMLGFIRGSEMVYYYVKEAYAIEINHDEFQGILSTINATHDSIKLITIAAEAHRKLTIVTINNKDAIRTNWHTDIKRSEMSWEKDDELGPCTIFDTPERQYLLEFTLKCKTFKKCITGIEGMTREITIYKEKNEPLTFKFEYITEHGKGSHDFYDNKLMALREKIDDGAYVTTTIPINYLRPIASMGLCDAARLYVSSESDLITVFKMDAKNGSDGKPIRMSHSCEIKFITKNT